MSKVPGKNQNSKNALQEFVAVTFAEDMSQARDYKNLLRKNDIPATIKRESTQWGNSRGVAVMVPEDCLDEAHILIESRDLNDDFYDFAFDNDDDDFETGYDDDGFEL